MAVDSNRTGSLAAMMFVEKVTAISLPLSGDGLVSRSVIGEFMGPAAVLESIGIREWSIIATQATADLALLTLISKSLIGAGRAAAASNTCWAAIGLPGLNICATNSMTKPSAASTPST